MLRVELPNARPGMKLALPVYNPRQPGRTLLSVGYELRREEIVRLRELRVRSVWVRYPSLEFLGKYADPALVESQSEVVGHIAETFESLQNESTAKLDYHTYLASVEKLVEHLMLNPQAALFLGDIASADNVLMRHSAAVSYLSLLLGMKLEGYLVRERPHVDPVRAKEVRNLGLGAMLHDIGVTQLAPQTVSRYYETEDESDPAWREHPAVGYRLVRGRIDPSAAVVVLHHHQRFDGTGYAGEGYAVQRERTTHVFARIAAVADRFDRLRNPPNRPAVPTVAVLRQMLSEPIASWFDPRVLGALLAVTPPYPPASTVRLSDGRWAVVIDHRPSHPCRPTVQIIPPPASLNGEDVKLGPTIDLAEQSSALHVVEAEGRDVRHLNFARPERFDAEVHPLAAWL